MTVWYGIESVPASAPAFAATIGNFDGVHLGHRAILDSLVAAARTAGVSSLLVTFDPHPLAVVAPERRPRLLQTRRQKLDALAETGLGAVLFLRFDRAMSQLSGEEFFAKALGDRIRLAAVHVGRHFRFGRNREGDLEVLERIGLAKGFHVRGVPQVVLDGETVSSSAIRRSLEQGDVERARRMLGRPFALSGEVKEGAGRGRLLEFPTANLAVENEMIPSRGVYITETSVLAARHPSITNVGVRPTFGEGALAVETHILDFEEDVYGERMEIGFLARLREEKRFDSPSELADQIARDRAAAFAYFQGLPTLSR
jgi:riboflavin kinase/FMN adenylyltransferase